MGKKKKKKRRKYDIWLGDPDYRAHKVKLSGDPSNSWQQSQALLERNIPPPTLLSMCDNPGFFLGLPSGPGSGSYVGIPQKTEDHILVLGGSGSGKSSGIAKPTLKTWDGAICATDVKGELSEYYEKLYLAGHVFRPYTIFDPMDVEGPSYDPFWWPSKDRPENLYNNIREIAFAIIPTILGDKDPFWTQSEQYSWQITIWKLRSSVVERDVLLQAPPATLAAGHCTTAGPAGRTITLERMSSGRRFSCPTLHRLSSRISSISVMKSRGLRCVGTPVQHGSS